MSEYYHRVMQEENARFEKWRHEQQLRQLFESGGTLDESTLTAEDRKFLKTLQEEKALQSKHDRAFLDGFTGKK